MTSVYDLFQENILESFPTIQSLEDFLYMKGKPVIV